MLGEHSGLGCRLRASLLLLTLDKCLYSHKSQHVGAAKNPGVFWQHWQQLFLGARVLKGKAIHMLESEFLPHRTCLCREEPMVVPAVWFCGLQSNSSHRGRRDADAAGTRASPAPLLQSLPAPQRHLSLRQDGMALGQRGLTVAWQTLGKLCSLFHPPSSATDVLVPPGMLCLVLFWSFKVFR